MIPISHLEIMKEMHELVLLALCPWYRVPSHVAVTCDNASVLSVVPIP